MNYNSQNDNFHTNHEDSWDSQLQELVLKIKGMISARSEGQFLRLANSILIYQSLETFFVKFSEEAEQFQSSMQHIQKNLNYEKPFRIAVVAVTGQGKSTLLNALLSRNLVVIGDMGGAATGCAQQIFQDVRADQPEIAKVEYRDEQNILSLINQHFIQRYHLDVSDLPSIINEEYVRLLAKQEPLRFPDYEDRREFDKMRDALVDVAQQFVRHGTKAPKVFQLNNKEHTRRLEQLTDENSKHNTDDATREIGLIKCVNYHIRPSDSSALRLPQNVCLVDLPGVGATQFHNLIIYEGIQDADAILFVVHPRRFDTEQNRELLDRARRFITLEGDPESTERIFLVINAKDEIMAAATDTAKLQQMRRKADQFMEKLFPGSSQHCSRFEISAWAALQAQKVKRGESSDNPNKYSSVQTDLGVQDQNPESVWQASHVPLLINGLNTFIDQRIDRQLREAEFGLNRILSACLDLHQREHQMMTEGSGEFFLREIVNQQLDEQLSQIRERLQEFRRRQLSSLETSRPRLEIVASRLFDDVDLEVQAELPDYWKAAFNQGTFELAGVGFASIMQEQFLGAVNVSLLQRLSSRIDILAQELTDAYQSALDIAGIPSNIANRCFEQIPVDAIADQFEQHLDRMRQNLETAARSLVIMQLADPARWLIPFSTDGVPQPSPLMAAIPAHFKRELDSSAFDNFMQQVRVHYDATITSPCITGLFNLYRYELLCGEQAVLNSLKKNFERMRLSNDPDLTKKILDTIRDENLQTLDVIEEKIQILSYLKVQISLNYSQN